MAAGPLGSAAASATRDAAAAVIDPDKDAAEPSSSSSPVRLSRLRLSLLRRPDWRRGPGWGIIVGFTVSFLATYPVHMYVAEVYVLHDSFAFLFVKYCLGFLFILFVPLVILLADGNIRSGVRSVFGSAVLCSLQEEDEDENENEDEGGVGKDDSERRIQEERCRMETLVEEPNV